MITTWLKQGIHFVVSLPHGLPVYEVTDLETGSRSFKVFLTVKENLVILQYIFTSHLYQYLIYLLPFLKSIGNLKKKKLPSVYFVFIRKQHVVNAFSAIYYHVIRHTVMLSEGFSREMPSILTCHLSWTISQQLGQVHGYVTEISFNVNTNKTPFPKQL